VQGWPGSAARHPAGVPRVTSGTVEQGRCVQRRRWSLVTVTSLEGTVEGQGRPCWEAERRGQDAIWMSRG
jgi:hypothetical protein